MYLRTYVHHENRSMIPEPLLMHSPTNCGQLVDVMGDITKGILRDTLVNIIEELLFIVTGYHAHCGYLLHLKT